MEAMRHDIQAQCLEYKVRLEERLALEREKTHKANEQLLTV